MIILRNISQDQKYIWLIWPFLALITLGLYTVIPYNSAFIEGAFSTGWFHVFRTIWDFTIGWSPIPLIYFLVTGILFYWYRGLRSAQGVKNKLLTLGKRTVIVASVVLLAFYWLWGFNYKRVPLADKLKLYKQEVDIDRLFQEYQRVSDTLNQLAQQINIDSDLEGLEIQVRRDLLSLYHDLDIFYAGRVRVRRLRPKGSLLHISTAGVYLPFVGEGHLDAGLHPITHPFTMMHEMSHGYGFTGEDICNFLALLGCIRSGNPTFRYSGYFGYWRYLRSNAFRADKDKFRAMSNQVSKEVQQDYDDIIAYANRYPDILPKLRDLIYDNYLKSHGIQEGLSNYSSIINLALAYQDRYGSLELERSIRR